MEKNRECQTKVCEQLVVFKAQRGKIWISKDLIEIYTASRNGPKKYPTRELYYI